MALGTGFVEADSCHAPSRIFVHMESTVRSKVPRKKLMRAQQERRPCSRRAARQFSSVRSVHPEGRDRALCFVKTP